MASSDDLSRLAVMFARFAEYEFRASSPRYTLLAETVAGEPELARPLLAAPGPQRRAILYFAAVQYLLRTVAPGHPLAGYLPTFGGHYPPGPGMVAAFVDFVTSHAEPLARICATRMTQTNEPRRTALLRPAFGRAAEWLGGRSLALVELGTSAGLLLLPDRYGYRYTGGGHTRRYGRPDAPPALVMDCVVRGDGWPRWLSDEPAIGARVGIDLSPVGSADADGVTWLRSCIWPEHVDRLARLDAALAEASLVSPRLVAGDMLASLPEVLSTVDDVPCVFASNSLTYLGARRRSELAHMLAGVGAERDLVVALNEAAQCGVHLFTADGPPASAGLAVATLTVIAWIGGRATVEVLAETGPHGEWLRWARHEYRYALG